MSTWFARISTLGAAADPDLAVVADPPSGAEALSSAIARGEPAAHAFPAEARVRLREEHPGIKLSSVLSSLHQHLIVSTELRALIQRHAPGPGIEYLPFALHDHRGRLHSRDYVIVHPLGTLDCLDEAASGLVHGVVPRVREVVLSEEKLGSAPQLFRARFSPTTHVVGLALARAMKEADMSNVFLTPLAITPRARPT